MKEPRKTLYAMKRGDASKLILYTAQTLKTFTPWMLMPYMSLGDAGRNCRRLVEEGKLRLVRKAKVGRYGCPAIYGPIRAVARKGNKHHNRKTQHD